MQNTSYSLKGVLLFYDIQMGNFYHVKRGAAERGTKFHFHEHTKNLIATKSGDAGVHLNTSY